MTYSTNHDERSKQPRTGLLLNRIRPSKQRSSVKQTFWDVQGETAQGFSLLPRKGKEERMLVLYDSILEFLPGLLTQKPGKRLLTGAAGLKAGVKGWLRSLPRSTPEESCVCLLTNTQVRSIALNKPDKCML